MLLLPPAPVLPRVPPRVQVLAPTNVSGLALLDPATGVTTTLPREVRAHGVGSSAGTRSPNWRRKSSSSVGGWLTREVILSGAR